MPKTKKFSIFITFILCALSACNTELSKDINGTFGILATELERNTIQLTEDINLKISEASQSRVEVSENEKVSILNPILDSVSIVKMNTYHKLTEAYVAFLTEIEDEFIQSDTNPLIQNGEITQRGKEYLGRTKLYSEKIQKLWDNEFTKNKVILQLNTDHIQNRKGTKISHISYYFEDLPTKGIIVYLKQKKYNVLLLEKDFLNDLIFQNLTTQPNSKN
ncbi:gliding motility-associated protein GldM [Kordia sp. SMS9]|uniref:hypothetical protein n=1 Tax=Kordia sp. SMS9 TaxID=2282170 RepID=UPI000E0D5AD5|nr:hypothetical protein [Kordia sp. SMS9]AXG71617.1 gliding motility-associated protein GldM [Kordia sp. SMS9]